MLSTINNKIASFEHEPPVFQLSHIHMCQSALHHPVVHFLALVRSHLASSEAVQNTRKDWKKLGQKPAVNKLTNADCEKFVCSLYTNAQKAGTTCDSLILVVLPK